MVFSEWPLGADLAQAEELADLAHRRSVVLPFDQQLIAAPVEDGRASYTDLARRADTTPLTARRRLEALVDGQLLRLATEVDLARLGIRTEALLWITVAPGGLEETGRQLSRHPQFRFASATTGPANLLVAVAAADLNALYHFMGDIIGALTHISTIEVTPSCLGSKGPVSSDPAVCEAIARPARRPRDPGHRMIRIRR